MGRRQATQTTRNHIATEANADGEDDPEAKSFKPSRGGGGGGGGGGEGFFSSSIAETFNDDGSNRKAQQRSRARQRHSQSSFVFDMFTDRVDILDDSETLYAPFIDVFGGDLLDQLLASEEGQGHVSAVSVSDDFFKRALAGGSEWNCSLRSTASSHVTDKRKKKNDEHRNRKLFSVESSYE